MSQPQTQFNLAWIILAELTRHPVRVLLYLLVLFSAVGVILSSHHHRQSTIEMEALLQAQDQLDVEWRNLILEQSALTEHNRIEERVKSALNMRRPTPEEEVVVKVK